MRPNCPPNPAIVDELKRRNPWTLTRTIARAHFTTPGRVIGVRRIKRDVEARQAIWASLYDMRAYTLTELGQIFGRDHTTILMGIRRHKQRLAGGSSEAS